MTSPVIEAMARKIAHANGDEFSDAFTRKDRWVAKRGMSGGRFRDVNEPFQSDYLDMAEASLKALEENITDEMLDRVAKELGICDASKHWIAEEFTAMLRAAREE